MQINIKRRPSSKQSKIQKRSKDSSDSWVGDVIERCILYLGKKACPALKGGPGRKKRKTFVNVSEGFSFKSILAIVIFEKIDII